MRRLTYLSTAQFIFLLAAIVPLMAAEKAAEKKDPRAADKKAIQEAGQSYLKAFAEGDAKKVAEHFTQNGEFFSAGGRHIKGRETIEKEFANHFALYPGQKLKPTRKGMRFIRPDVAVVHGVSKVEPAPSGPPSKCTYSVLLVKEDGRWLMDHVRETMTFATSNYDKLAGLEWLVGRWTYGGDSPQIRSADISFRWSRNKNYLLREYVIRLPHGETLSGTQRIGWDPLTKSVCSWLFASDGSYTKGVWTNDNGRWVVRSHGFLQDGRKTSATNIIAPVDADTFTFESTNRTVDGKPEPNVGPVEIKRRRPQK